MALPKLLLLLVKLLPCRCRSLDVMLVLVLKSGVVCGKHSEMAKLGFKDLPSLAGFSCLQYELSWSRKKAIFHT